MAHLSDLKELRELLSKNIERVASDIADYYEQECGPEFSRPKDAWNYVFGGGTDGAIGRDIHISLAYLEGTGIRTGNALLDEQLEKLFAARYEDAVTLFCEEHYLAKRLYAERGDKSMTEVLDECNIELATAWDHYITDEYGSDDDYLLIRVGAFFNSAIKVLNHEQSPMVSVDNVSLWQTGFINGGYVVGPKAPEQYSSVTLWWVAGPVDLNDLSALEPLLKEFRGNSLVETGA